MMAQLQVGFCLWNSSIEIHNTPKPFLITLATEDYRVASSELIFRSTTPSQLVTIAIVDDTILENSETINVTLMSVDPAAILNPASAVITIEDNDGKLLSCTVLSYGVRVSYMCISSI